MLVVFAALLASCNDSGSSITQVNNDRESSATRVKGESGVSIEVPQGWKTRGRDLGIQVYAYSEFLGDNDCDPKDPHVSFRIEATPTQEPGFPYGERPSSFGPTSGSGWQSGFDSQSCNSRSQGIRFPESGRWIDVYITAATGAAPARIAEVYGMLDSLVVEPVST